MTIAPHILANLEPFENSVYVLDGKCEGWHEFKTSKETVDYMSLLVMNEIDFVLNPMW
jgi:hypothetical protein